VERRSPIRAVRRRFRTTSLDETSGIELAQQPIYISWEPLVQTPCLARRTRAGVQMIEILDGTSDRDPVDAELLERDAATASAKTPDVIMPNVRMS